MLFKLRWPEFVDRVESPADWQQLYWERHLQKYANVNEMTDDLFFFLSRFVLSFMLIRVTVVLMKQLRLLCVRHLVVGFVLLMYQVSVLMEFLGLICQLCNNHYSFFCCR